MDDPYRAPGTLAEKPPWKGPPTLKRSLRTVWSWLRRSWWRIALVSIGLEEVALAIKVHVIGPTDGPYLAVLLSALMFAVELWCGLIVSGAVIRIVLDEEAGRAVSIRQALVFGVGRAPAMLVAVALRMLLAVLATLALGVGRIAVHGRLLSVDALFALNLQDRDEGVFGGAKEQSEGHTWHLAVLWICCLGPRIALNVVMFCSPLLVGVMDWPHDWIMLPARPLSILAKISYALLPLGGLAFLLSSRHNAGLATPLFWREDPVDPPADGPQALVQPLS